MYLNVVPVRVAHWTQVVETAGGTAVMPLPRDSSSMGGFYEQPVSEYWPQEGISNTTVMYHVLRILNPSEGMVSKKPLCHDHVVSAMQMVANAAVGMCSSHVHNILLHTNVRRPGRHVMRLSSFAILRNVYMATEYIRRTLNCHVNSRMSRLQYLLTIWMCCSGCCTEADTHVSMLCLPITMSLFCCSA